MTEQTKVMSGIEAVCNVGSGMIIALCISQLAVIFAAEIQEYIWSGFVWNISTESNIVMTIVLTVVSMSRSFAWRRYFNKKGAPCTTFDVPPPSGTVVTVDHVYSEDDGHVVTAIAFGTCYAYEDLEVVTVHLDNK